MPTPDLRKASAIVMAASMPLLTAAAPPLAEPIAAWPSDSVQLATRPVGRVEKRAGQPGWRYQWPGTYFEARFTGTTLFVDLGSGGKHARLSIDNHEVADLDAPATRVLKIQGLTPSEHHARVDIVSESRDGVQTFAGFAVPRDARQLKPSPRPRAIEFIGDSYTVGYGAGSSRRECSDEEVWRTTDNSLAFGPQVARHFDADYRIMAISGRGMVRNFANAGGRTLPEAYDRLLPDDPSSSAAVDDPAWSPQLVVIGLGTNDFSTPVGTDEPWKDGAGLAAAFEQRYVDFASSLHRRHPSSRFVLLASDVGEGAAARAIHRVRSRLAEAGMSIADVVTFGELDLDGCNWHPSRSDQQRIARRLIEAVERLLPAWVTRAR